MGVLYCESVMGLAFYAPLISGFSITRLSSLFQWNASNFLSNSNLQNLGSLLNQ